MADTRASMIMTASSLVLTITITQMQQLDLLTVLLLLITGLLAIIFSIFAIIPPMHAYDGVNLFYSRSFAEIEEDEFIALGKEVIAGRALFSRHFGNCPASVMICR